MSQKICSGLAGMLLGSFLSGNALAKRELQYPLRTVPFFSTEHTTVNKELAAQATKLAEHVITEDDHPQLLRYHRDLYEEASFERVTAEFQIGSWLYSIEVTNAGGKSSWDFLRFSVSHGKGSKKKLIYGLDDGLDGNADEVSFPEGLKEKELEDLIEIPVTGLNRQERAQKLYQAILVRGMEFYEKRVQQ